MIISFNGDHGSGKSTVAVRLAEELGYERYYMGQIFRDMAKDHGKTYVEFLDLIKTDPSYDKKIDDYVIKLGKEKDDFVIESRTAWHFIPHSLKIYLKVDEKVAAERIFLDIQNKAKSRQNEDKNMKTPEDVLQSNRKRKEEDDARYQKYYGIDVNDMTNYDFVLDTTDLTREEVFEKVLEFIKNQEK